MKEAMRLRTLAVATCLLAGTAGVAHAQFFNAVYSRNGSDVIAVGDSGQVYRSLNAGANWLRFDVGARPLRDVAARGFNIVMVGDSGKIWRSTNSGGSWGLTVLSGTPALHSLAWPSDNVLFACGAGGTLYRSGDGGQSWQAQTSGTAQRLRSIRFRDDQTGWAAGDGGTVLSTANGGASWTPITVPTTRNLLSVDFLGSQVWVVGEHGVAIKSANSGGLWTNQNLRLDAGADVRVVWIQSADSVYIAGGGGFVRRSADGGANWTFLQHTLQGPLTDLYFAGGNGWMVNRGTRLIPRTANDGTSWTNPAGTFQRRTWPKLFDATGTIRGSTMAINPIDHKTLFMMMGPTLYRSRDDAATWTIVGSVPSADKANAFVVSPKDSNLMLAAVGSPDRVVRSINGGVSWTDCPGTNAAFGEYGVPLEMHPDKPDTVLFGPDGSKLLRSTDFGLTWSAYGNFTFISPCDIVIVPESDSGVVLVGDGITSSGVAKIHRSNDNALNFVPTFAPVSGASEIPTMSIGRLRNTVPYASAWSSGAFKRSLDGGLTWVNVVNVGSTWGNDVAKDDPNVSVMGVYGASNGFLSMDGGASYLTLTGLSSPNYSLYARDRGFILAEQGGGIYKLAVYDTFLVATGQSVTLAAPDGGEDWIAGTVHNVTWNVSNVVQAKIEYRKSAGDPWQQVALVDGTAGSYAWTCPNDSTSAAQIRVSDAWDGSPSDISSGPFRIRVPRLDADPAAYDFGGVTPNDIATQVLTLTNYGDATLNITSIASNNARFWTARTAMTIGAGATDTTLISYQPDAADADTGLVTVNYGTGAAGIAVTGHGLPPVGVEDGERPIAFALYANRPNPFNGRTLIRYAIPVRQRVTVDVYDVQGHRVARLVDGVMAPGNYSVPFGSGAPGVQRLLRSGVYFVRVESGAFRASRKVLMLN